MREYRFVCRAEFVCGFSLTGITLIINAENYTTATKSAQARASEIALELEASETYKRNIWVVSKVVCYASGIDHDRNHTIKESIFYEKN